MKPLTGVESLTPRQLEIIAIICSERGTTNEEIAKRLGLSPYTVGAHARDGARQLGIRGRKYREELWESWYYNPISKHLKSRLK